jgi:hypothetical protein
VLVVDFDEDNVDDFVLGGTLTTGLAIFDGRTLTFQVRDFADAGISTTAQFGQSLGLTYDSSGAPVVLVGAPADSAQRGRVLAVEQCAGLAPLTLVQCRLPCGAAQSGTCAAGTCAVPNTAWPCGSPAACDEARGVCRTDAGVLDAGSDGGSSVSSDAGGADGGSSVSSDAGGSDAGGSLSSDAGAPDAGAQDAGARDGGVPDTGVAEDAGAEDAGALDAGAPPSQKAFTYGACGCSAGPVAPSAVLAALLLRRRRRAGAAARAR